jgi:tetratricopeptide (TPR) repeat protein
MTTMNMSWTDYKQSALQAEAVGNFDLAEKCWTQTVMLLRNEPNSLQSLSSALERLANSCASNNKASYAIPLLLESLDIKSRALGNNHPLVAQVENDLARIYYINGQLPEAISFAQRCLKNYELIHGQNSEQVATMCTNIASAFQRTNKHEYAEPYYKRALLIRTKVLGEKNPQTVKVLKDYAKLLREMHRYQEATHLDACAEGSITGSWKVVTLNPVDSLAPSKECNFCGQNLGQAKKCSRCGTPAGSLI